MTFITTALKIKITLLYETGVAQFVHRPPVGIQGPRCSWVYQVLDKVVKCDVHSRFNRIFYCLWWIRLVAITANNVLEDGKKELTELL